MERIQSDQSGISKAVQVLKQGGVIIYPTDTVYGLGADAANPAAVARVRAIKARDDTKPILAMVSGIDMLKVYATVTPSAHDFAQAFLPGPVSLILTARGGALESIASENGSVGFRIPNNSLCAALTNALGKPITSTSVNRAGMEQPYTIEGMLEQLGDAAHSVDLVLDAGILPASKPSTVIDVRGAMPTVLREGACIEEIKVFLDARQNGGVEK